MILFVVLLSDVCGIRVVSRQNGDIMLGALFPIHAKGTNQSCGLLQVIAFNTHTLKSNHLVCF